MDIKTLSVEALKALAYDQLAFIDQSKANLRAINEELAGREQEPEEKVAEKKK